MLENFASIEEKIQHLNSPILFTVIAYFFKVFTIASQFILDGVYLTLFKEAGLKIYLTYLTSQDLYNGEFVLQSNSIRIGISNVEAKRLTRGISPEESGVVIYQNWRFYI